MESTRICPRLAGDTNEVLQLLIEAAEYRNKKRSCVGGLRTIGAPKCYQDFLTWLRYPSVVPNYVREYLARETNDSVAMPRSTIRFVSFRSDGTVVPFRFSPMRQRPD
mgnify:CR=1 FL=1